MRRIVLVDADGREVDPKPRVDPRPARYAKALAALKRWRTRSLLARNKVKKLERTCAYYKGLGVKPTER